MLHERMVTSTEKVLPELLKNCNFGQVEIKWGGTSKNLTENFWPPKVPNTTFFKFKDHNFLESPSNFKQKF